MLGTIDLTKSLTKEEYVRDLIRYQLQLRALAYQLYVQKRPLVIVYEGWDAGGKGGNIKRITEKLDPRGYEVYPIAAPAGEDKTHHYLYRFWRRLKPPDEKQILIFDRSWYGRVMVERLEGFCTEEEWKRAFREINEFERQLVDFGTILAKFWIHISKEEQLRRFQMRQETPYKAWKLTDEDWRNRQKWDRYEEAINDMLLKTSTLTAPWTIVEGNCKWYARVKVLAGETLVPGGARCQGLASRNLQQLQHSRQVGRQHSFKFQALARHRMFETQPLRMEELPLQGQLCPAPPVYLVAHHRMADRGQMHTDLVGAARLRLDLHKAVVASGRSHLVGKPLQDVVLGDGLAAARQHGHSLPALRIASDRGFDAAPCWLQVSIEQREIGFAHLALFELPL
jgi:polyphosphate kinase 2 (PPK2 family)